MLVLNRQSPQHPPAPRLVTSIEPLEEALVVRPRGELDVGTVERLETPVHAALEESSTVILDLGGVSFIDSCGLRMLLRSGQRARELDRAFFLVRLSAPVSQVIAVTDTADLLPLVTDPSGAGFAAGASGTCGAWKAQPVSHSSPAPPAASDSSWPGSSRSTAST